MLRARLNRKDGTPIVLLGLEGENMARLMSDEPIRISNIDLHTMLGVGLLEPLPAFDILIIGGKDGQEMLEKLRAGMHSDTIVHGQLDG